MVRYNYHDLENKTKIPDDCIKFGCYECNLTLLPKLSDSLKELWCNNNKLIELPELPNLLIYLFCGDNKLTELPELPMTLKELMCKNNNIKYLSPNNCEIMKNGCELTVLNNPFSAGFTRNNDFIKYLMNL